MSAAGLLFQSIAMLMTLIGFLVIVIQVIEFFREMKKMLTEQCALLRKLVQHVDPSYSPEFASRRTE